MFSALLLWFPHDSERPSEPPRSDLKRLYGDDTARLMVFVSTRRRVDAARSQGAHGSSQVGRSVAAACLLAFFFFFFPPPKNIRWRVYGLE